MGRPDHVRGHVIQTTEVVDGVEVGIDKSAQEQTDLGQPVVLDQLRYPLYLGFDSGGHRSSMPNPSRSRAAGRRCQSGSIRTRRAR